MSSADIPPALNKLLTINYHVVKSLFSVKSLASSFNASRDWSWNNTDFVKLPCSDKNIFFNSGTSRWLVIVSSLSKFVRDSTNKATRFTPKNFQDVIAIYNRSDTNKCDFENLTKVYSDESYQILLSVAEEAMRLPQLLDNPIPLLKQGENKTIFMTQRQAFCLMANAYFCTYPQYATISNSKLSNINFFKLFESNPHANGCKIQKLCCILNYFKLAMFKLKPGLNENKEMKNGHFISFERRIVKDFPKWNFAESPMAELEVRNRGTIEDDGHNMLQVIFSNKSVGGGILGNGSIMEEIRFSICPELIVSRLFTESLLDNEVLVVTGAQRFSNYNGYGKSFTFNGPFAESVTLDEYGRIDIEVVAMDAVKFSENEKNDQYKMNNVIRELNKCFCAFKTRTSVENKKPIASGNWGCGSFNGDVQLKLLIQWMAASHVGRKLVIFTFGDKNLTDSNTVINCLKNKRVSICQLHCILEMYSHHVQRTKNQLIKRKTLSVFEYILRPKTWTKLDEYMLTR